jgi:HK97 family phage prohead protease
MALWKEGDTGTKLAVPFKLKADAEEGVVKGYASIFNVLDRQGDAVMPGAFADSINTRHLERSLVKMLWQHNPSQPLGTPTVLTEDQQGLYFEVPVVKTADNIDRLKLMAEKAVDRVSIGFNVIKASEFEDEEARAQLTGWARLLPLTKLEKLELIEFSAVTFAANESAVILAVKSAFGWLPTFDQLPDTFHIPATEKAEPVIPDHKQAALPEAVEVEEDTTESEQTDDNEVIDEVKSDVTLITGLGDIAAELKHDARMRVLADCAKQLTGLSA